MPFHDPRTPQRDRLAGRDPFARRDPMAERDLLAKNLRSAWQRDTLFDEFGGDLTKLTGSVGVNASNHRDDNAKVQALLARAGHLDLGRTEGPTGWGLFTVDKAITQFQKANDLKPDGRITPNGPTIAKLGQAAGVGAGAGTEKKSAAEPGLPVAQPGQTIAQASGTSGPGTSSGAVRVPTPTAKQPFPIGAPVLGLEKPPCVQK